jgi:hypothetical protein
MKDLFIQGTGSLPTVSLKLNGELKIVGRALPEDAVSFFSPLLSWINGYSADEVNIEINLDYFNTSVSKQLLDFFRIIENKNTIKNVKLKWMYESGEIYKELLPKFNFTFHKYAEIVN